MFLQKDKGQVIIGGSKIASLLAFVKGNPIINMILEGNIVTRILCEYTPRRFYTVLEEEQNV